MLSFIEAALALSLAEAALALNLSGGRTCSLINQPITYVEAALALTPVGISTCPSRKIRRPMKTKGVEPTGGSGP